MSEKLSRVSANAAAAATHPASKQIFTNRFPKHTISSISSSSAISSSLKYRKVAAPHHLPAKVPMPPQTHYYALRLPWSPCGSSTSSLPPSPSSSSTDFPTHHRRRRFFSLFSFSLHTQKRAGARAHAPQVTWIIMCLRRVHARARSNRYSYSSSDSFSLT